jgi:hypothetical protein
VVVAVRVDGKKQKVVPVAVLSEAMLLVHITVAVEAAEARNLLAVRWDRVATKWALWGMEVMVEAVLTAVAVAVVATTAAVAEPLTAVAVGLPTQTHHSLRA